MSVRTTAPAAAVASLTMAAVAVFTVAGNYPTFDGAAEFRDMMVPAGAPVGSLIYRLRASDHDKDYPLYFQATGTYHHRRRRPSIRFCAGSGELFERRDERRRKHVRPIPCRCTGPREPTSGRGKEVKFASGSGPRKKWF